LVPAAMDEAKKKNKYLKTREGEKRKERKRKAYGETERC
jgi:hypothetical protein